jgi:sugar/nucleoside kinase (ribokinase family)
MAPRILVVGDVINDVVVVPSAEPVGGSDIPAVIRFCPGGSAANQAAWLGHLGAAVVFVGRAGHHDADFHRSELARFGVDARIAADPRAQTGQIVVLVAPDGERTMITDRGANARLSLANAPCGLVDGTDLLLLSGYVFAEPGPRKVARSLLERARERGVRVAVDPGSRTMATGASPEAFLRWTHGATICFPNFDEAAALTGETEPGAMATRLSRHYDLVVVKLGADGAVVATRGGPAVLVAGSEPAAGSAVIDSTGAGDAFCAAFLMAWLAGADPVTSAHAAAALAAAAIGFPGGRPPG